MAPGLVSHDHESGLVESSQKANGIFEHGCRQRDFPEAESHDLVLASFRCLVVDIVQHFNGGHPGGAMGMAPLGVALWKYTMNYSPSNPSWFARDRFVLSNGHCCIFQYMFLHLTGYRSMTKEQLLKYHSARYDSICPGHPEIEIEGIEVTTGPLGQGIANAVGLAMAEAHLAATYNRPGFDVVDNMTYCTVGDACLQEGVGLEAISMAGHFRLRKLVVLYDNNQVTCDGSVDMTNTEHVNDKMRASGWNVVDIMDGDNDIKGIVEALDNAKSSGKPTFINVRTIIGVGSNIQGKKEAHGAALGADDVYQIKQKFGMNPEEHFVISETVRKFYEPLVERGKQLEQTYDELLTGYAKAHPELAAEFALRRAGKITKNWTEFMPRKEDLPIKATPSRKSGGIVMNPLAQNIGSFMVGTADLSPSVNMQWPGQVDFQHPDLRTECGSDGNYTGRYIHFGIREHAMVSISNGLAAYNIGTLFPVTSSFFMFYIYCAAGVRMSALQQLPLIHIATHDSIGTGEDGPTHQPIALASLYRAMPNTLYIRPADTEEVCGAMIAVLEHMGPHTRFSIDVDASSGGLSAQPSGAAHQHEIVHTSMLSLSRHGLPQLHTPHDAHPFPQALTSRAGVQRGAYVLHAPPGARVTLLSSGSELCIALAAAKVLGERHGLPARVVSFPCMVLFDRQDKAYRDEVLKRRDMPTVVVEAYALRGWERYADTGWGMTSFGRSGPGSEVYRWFGFEGDVIADKVRAWMAEGEGEGVDMWWLGGWKELSDGFVWRGDDGE